MFVFPYMTRKRERDDEDVRNTAKVEKTAMTPGWRPWWPSNLGKRCENCESGIGGDNELITKQPERFTAHRKCKEEAQ